MATDETAAKDERLERADRLKQDGDQAVREDRGETAAVVYAEALELFRDAGEQLPQAECSQGLGMLALKRGEYETAFGHFLDSMNIHAGLADLLRLQGDCGYLAMCAAEAGHLNQALMLTEGALKTGREINDTFGQTITLNLQKTLFAQMENFAALLATLILRHRMLLELELADEAEHLSVQLEHLKKNIPHEAFEELGKDPEAVRAYAVSVIARALSEKGVDILVWPQAGPAEATGQGGETDTKE